MPIDVEDRKMMMKVALTSMGSKAVGGAKERFAEIAIDAVKQIAEKTRSQDDCRHRQYSTCEEKPVRVFSSPNL